jgi:hypothetical protein
MPGKAIKKYFEQPQKNASHTKNVSLKLHEFQNNAHKNCDSLSTHVKNNGIQN